MKLEDKRSDGQAREPPKFMRYAIWCSGGEFKDDALQAFDGLFRSAVEKFGYRHALVWGASQCLRSLPRALWALLIRLAGSLLG
ncbi:MAG: hypothetical protein ABWX67_11795 [Allosphingosinicella sp.]